MRSGLYSDGSGELSKVTKQGYEGVRIISMTQKGKIENTLKSGRKRRKSTGRETKGKSS